MNRCPECPFVAHTTGADLRTEREAAGLSLRQLAARLGRSHQRVLQWEPQAQAAASPHRTAPGGHLRKQHEWGDISDEAWRTTKRDIEAQLAGLPDEDKLVLFDREREVLLSRAENIARATPEQLQRLLARVVERVDTADRGVVRVVWTAPARPFFAPASTDPSLRLLCPQGDSNP